MAYLVNELHGRPSLNASLTAPGVTAEDASDDVVYRFEVPGSILDAHKHLLPRTDPAVQATFAARRALARHALNAYRAVHPAPVSATAP
jgi:4'-phosphopantetheinyl transferase EntD